jgi:hypothetical protein
MTRLGRTILALASLSIVCAPAAAQTHEPAGDVARAVIDLGVSSAEMRRDAALATAFGQTVNRVADMALDRLVPSRTAGGWKQVAGRATAMYFVTLPVAAFSHTTAHETGHLARIHEAGLRVDRLRIDHWPWPVPFLRAELVLGSTVATRLSDQAWLGLAGGGSEASQLQADTLVDRIYSRDVASYFDWVLVASAKLDMPLYIWRDLRAAHVRDLASFFASAESFGDPRQYVLNYSRIVEAARGHNTDSLETIRHTAAALRRGAWWNLADFTLWTGMARAAAYVVGGTRETANAALAVGPLRLLPAAHFVLTPLGPERGVGVRALSAAFVSRVDVRWIDPPAGRRLWAGGVAMLARARASFVPQWRADLWQRAGDRPGFRIEAGGSRDLHIAGRTLGTNFEVGYKTTGYLAGTPNRAGVLVSIGATVRF